jgi:hypothetical protein
MTEQPTVKIDGKEYLIDSLSDDAKAQLGSLNLVDRRLTELQQEVAIMQTARNAYAQALAAALPKN